MEPSKSKNNYFNEKLFQELLIKYKETTVVGEKNIVISRDRITEEKLCKEVNKIVNAIIYVYNYNCFEPFEDLQQHAMLACYTNFLKFNIEKGTAFNYFSLIAKKSLLNYTTRKKKHRGHFDIEEQQELEIDMEIDFTSFLENLEKNFLEIVDENFVGLTRKKYLKISVLIVDYMKKTQKFINKTDMFSWIRSYGLRTNDIKEFIKDIAIYKKELFINLDINSVEQDIWENWGWKK